MTPSGEPGVFGLRWFTPSVEVDLCGHATLATAHALRQWGVADGETPLTFHTRSGPLGASYEGERIALDFPAEPPAAAALPECLHAAVARRGGPLQRPQRLLHVRRALLGRGRGGLRSRTWPRSPRSGPMRCSSPPPANRAQAPTTCCGCSVPTSASTRTPPPAPPSAPRDPGGPRRWAAHRRVGGPPALASWRRPPRPPGRRSRAHLRPRHHRADRPPVLSLAPMDARGVELHALVGGHTPASERDARRGCAS